jgi:hypothetical protein
MSVTRIGMADTGQEIMKYVVFSQAPCVRRKYKEPFPCFNPTLVQLESAATRRNLTQICHFFRTFPNQHFPRA